MQRIGNRKDNFLAFENLYLAYKKAFKRTKTKEAYAFAYHVEREIFKLQDELSTGIYQPESYRYFIIHEPKERTISVAPFRDRVVHHALVRVLEPIYEKRFIKDSYATRKNKGTHKAILTAQKMLLGNTHYIKMDIKQFFPSINHGILTDTLKRTIKDKFVINLSEKIIHCGGDGTTGLPIGNLTSQFFANVYLNQFDHHMKECLRMKSYVRYMDDLIICSNDQKALLSVKEAVSTYLFKRLSLNVKAEATCMNESRHGLSFLGVRIFPSMIRIKQENFKRSLKKIKLRHHQFNHRMISSDSYASSMNSLVSHMNYFGTKPLKKWLVNKG